MSLSARVMALPIVSWQRSALARLFEDMCTRNPAALSKLNEFLATHAPLPGWAVDVLMSEDMIRRIVPFFRFRDLVTTTRVCKLWRVASNVEEQRRREPLLCALGGIRYTDYPAVGALDLQSCETQVFHIKKGTWTPADQSWPSDSFHFQARPTPLLELISFGTCVLNNAIFIVGGDRRTPAHASETSNRLLKMNVGSMRSFPHAGTTDGNSLDGAYPGAWVGHTPMHVSRSGLGVAICGGFLYAVGGTDSNGNALDIVERYDPHEDTWPIMSPISVARFGSVAQKASYRSRSVRACEA